MINLNTSNFNEEYFNLIKLTYPHLESIILYNNHLSYSNIDVDIKNLNLQSLSKDVFALLPFDVLNIIKIHVDIMDEIEYLKKYDYNATFLYIEIRSILVKKIIDQNDINKLNQFIDVYLTLEKYQDFLVDSAAQKFIFMKNVLRDNLYGELSSPGINYLLENIKQNYSNNNSKGKVLALVNPNFPTNYGDSNDLNNSKAGYANSLLLIYIILNIGFILAVMLIK